MKKISELHDIIGGKTFIVKVYRNSEWGEYINRLFVDGTELKGSAYHTDDKDDAIDTAGSMLGFYRLRADLIMEGVL